jgi:acetyltransferase
MEKLSDSETRVMMKRYGIPFVRQILAKNEKQVVKTAKKMGYPVVLKISSPDIIHKTDVGGVEIGIGNEEELKETYWKMMKNVKKKKPKAKIDGMIVQEMVPADSRELIIGGRRDPQFGPIIMFGLGGVWVEALKDVAFRLVPIERTDARKMMKEIRGYSLLEGIRGQKPVNFKLLEDVMISVSKLLWKNDRIQELDINPLFINEKKAIAVDARILV